MVSPWNRHCLLHIPPFFNHCSASLQKQKNIRSSATDILSAVKQTISGHGASSVTVVGHSLGAALALLDGVYLSLHLSASVNVRVIGYGMPRVGNQAFADWVDRKLSGQVTRINNREDPIPTLPGKFLGFHHSSGEIHITDSGTWDACPGMLFSSLVPPLGHACVDTDLSTRRVAFQARTTLPSSASSAMYRPCCRAS